MNYSKPRNIETKFDKAHTKHEISVQDDTYRLKLMLVDDSSIAKKLIKKHLANINATVVCEASNAQEAYDLYVEFEPDIVTMDVSMPGGSGLDAVKRIRQFDPQAKIIMITSHGEEETIMEAIESGASSFILKPVTKEKLIERFLKISQEKYKMFKNIYYFEKLDIKNDKLLKSLSVRTKYLALLAENSKELYDDLRDTKIDCIGGIFPQIIYGDKYYDKGIVLLEMSHEANFKVIKNIETPLQSDLSVFLQDKKTILTIVDGASSDTKKFIVNLQDIVNPESTVLGVGAGYASRESKPCVFSSHGLLKDAALIIYSHEPMQVGINHGYEKVSASFEVTQAESTVLKSLQENDAYLTYKNLLSTKFKKNITTENFKEIVLEYPLGIDHENHIVVRDIQKQESNGIQICGDVELEQMVRVLKADKDLLLEAGQHSIAQATATLEKDDMKFAFAFFGMSRKLFLEKDFSIEIKEIKEKIPHIPQIGAVGILEISNKNTDTIEIYNNSCMIGIMY